MAITSISPISIQGAQGLSTSQPSAASPVEQAGKTFSDLLNSLTQSENSANDLVTRFSMGDNVDVHELMLGLEQNDIQFKVAMSIRDKLVSAYNDVMRMQV